MTVTFATVVFDVNLGMIRRQQHIVVEPRCDFEQLGADEQEVDREVVLVERRADLAGDAIVVAVEALADAAERDEVASTENVLGLRDTNSVIIRHGGRPCYHLAFVNSSSPFAEEDKQAGGDEVGGGARIAAVAVGAEPAIEVVDWLDCRRRCRVGRMTELRRRVHWLLGDLRAALALDETVGLGGELADVCPDDRLANRQILH